MSNIEVILVDNQDNILGTMDKMHAHITGALHRAFSIVIFRVKSCQLEILLQQRGRTKYHCANLWSNACCSHPLLQEDLITTAERRLQEELNFTTKLHKLTSFCYRQDLSNGLIEHELDHILVGTYEQPIKLLNYVEAQAVKWVNLKFLQNWLNSNPQEFTPWFNLVLTIILKQENKLRINELLKITALW